MKRFLVVATTFCLCTMLIGCSTDSREGLIEDTITRINQAATAISNIKNRVNEAMKKADEKGTKLDLTDAMKSAGELKKIGEDAQMLKRRIDLDRATPTDEDRKNYAETSKPKLKSAFEDLVKRRNELNDSLKKAEQINQAAKDAVEKLREKIREAESPFVSLAR